MDKDAFVNSPSGNVGEIGTGDVAYSNFLPHPVPPKLELVGALSAADRKKRVGQDQARSPREGLWVA